MRGGRPRDAGLGVGAEDQDAARAGAGLDQAGDGVLGVRLAAGAGARDAVVGFLLPAATGAAPWPHPEPDFPAYAASDVVHAAADRGDRWARAAPADLEAPPGGDRWALRPAPEQLDGITG